MREGSSSSSVEMRLSGVNPIGATAEPGRGATRWVVLALLYLLVVCLVSPFYVDEPPAPRAGQPIREAPIVARVPFTVMLESRQRDWERRREMGHQRVWRFQAAAGEQARERLEQILERAGRFDPAWPPAEVAAAVAGLGEVFQSVAPEDAAAVLEALRDRATRDLARLLVDEVYHRHLVVRQLPRFLDQQRQGLVQVIGERELALREAGTMPERYLAWPVDFNFRWETLIREVVRREAPGNPPSEVAMRVLRLLLKASVMPDMEFDEEETAKRRDAFPREGPQAFVTGQELVGRAALGQPATEEQAAVLRAHRREVRRLANLRVMGNAAYVMVVLLLLGFYIVRISGRFVFTTFNTFLLSLPIVLPLAAQFVFLMIAEWRIDTAAFLFPAGAIGMLGVLLVDVRTALLLVTWGCLLFGLQVDFEFEHVVVALFGGYTAVAALRTIQRRYDAIVASVLVGAVNAVVILLIAFTQGPLDVLPYEKAAAGFLGGISNFLVLAVLPVVERFGVVTDMQLLELSGLHNPLLRAVEEQAPGTWQHTLNVSKLAEAAATEIGVNYLLVRAGCYYHDIGKVKKPEYFTENQVSPEDKLRHHNLKPIMSARIIMNHVKEGAEMARAAGLPGRIIDFITQHHGTSIIKYFHNKAEAQFEAGESKDPVREDDYRYPGPKPQTIEAAIVMLADSVEATATAKLSSRKVREDEIRQIVALTILDKFNDGQFDECNLTLRDLTIIREVFIKVLKSRFHTRIDYPRKGAPSAPPPRREIRREDPTPLPQSRDFPGAGVTPPPS